MDGSACTRRKRWLLESVQPHPAAAAAAAARLLQSSSSASQSTPEADPTRCRPDAQPNTKTFLSALTGLVWRRSSGVSVQLLRRLGSFRLVLAARHRCQDDRASRQSISDWSSRCYANHASVIHHRFGEFWVRPLWITADVLSSKCCDMVSLKIHHGPNAFSS